MVKAILVIASSYRPSVIAWNRCWVKPSVKGSKYSRGETWCHWLMGWWGGEVVIFSGNNSQGVDLSFVYNFLSKVLAIQVCHFIFALSFFVVFSSFFQGITWHFVGSFLWSFFFLSFVIFIGNLLSFLFHFRIWTINGLGSYPKIASLQPFRSPLLSFLSFRCHAFVVILTCHSLIHFLFETGLSSLEPTYQKHDENMTQQNTETHINI